MSISHTQSNLYPGSGEVSRNAAGSTFAEVDDSHRIVPAIEFRDVVLAFDERVILQRSADDDCAQANWNGVSGGRTF